jgi:hypothetical protein
MKKLWFDKLTTRWEAVKKKVRKIKEALGRHTKAAEPGSPFKVTEVSVMVSKKKSVNFNSCCVSYAIKATLNEANQDHLQALEELKDQLVVKVQEALNGKAATNQTAKSTTLQQSVEL